MKTLSATALLVLCLLGDPPDLLGQEALPTYTASYLAKAAGLSATAERQLEHLEGDRYRLSQAMEVRAFGATLGEISEYSQFRVDNGELQPEIYHYRQTGVSRKNEQVIFDWETGQAVSREDNEEWQIALLDGIVDKLSFQLQLRNRLATNPHNDVLIRLVDSDEVEQHRYRVTGTETVETALGNFDCLKVERIREPASERRTTFWLAKDWQLLLVKFEQTRGSRSESELLLQEATLGGQPVTPLP